MIERENFIKISTEKGGAKIEEVAIFHRTDVYTCKMKR